jgi:hypothetical protein
MLDLFHPALQLSDTLKQNEEGIKGIGGFDVYCQLEALGCICCLTVFSSPDIFRRARAMDPDP